MRPGRLVRWATFVRSFAIQGSWNYRTLVGTGFTFALIPVLRAVYRDDPAGLERAVARHGRLFNSHPYLGTIALGAVARMECSGEDLQVIERFKTAVRGSLGTLGDRLVWAGWRPVCLLLALTLLGLGAGWWVVLGVFLGIYNLGHILLRAWGYRLGWGRGRTVGERLRRYPLGPLQQGLMVTGAFLAGVVLPLVVRHGVALPVEAWLGAGGTLHPAWIAVAAVGGVLGARFGMAVRVPVVLVLVVYTLTEVIVGIQA